MTLKMLIKKLFKQHGLDPNRHFDVWICGFKSGEELDIIDKENPFECCHFLGYKKRVDLSGNSKFHIRNGKKYLDGSDVFKWLEFEVEDYEFASASGAEYWLFVKLADIDKPFN